MADRVLVKYEEERREGGPHWTLEVQRSSAGQPGLLFTIRCEMDDPKYHHLDREMTVLVTNGWGVIAPIVRWLEER